MKKIYFKNKNEYNKYIKQNKDKQKEQKNIFEEQVKRMILNHDSECIFGTDILYKTKEYDIVGNNWYINKQYKKAFDFCYNRNPDVNLNEVKAYEVPNKYMDEVDLLRSCGGCYVPSLQIIIIKKGKSKESFKNNIDKNIGKYRIECSHEDVFAHELFHAISHASGRCTRKFTGMEEEFVYQSTIDWFKDKGYSDDDIVEKYFLPFTLQDVLQNSYNKIALEFIEKSKVDKNILLWSKDTGGFLEDNAEKFVNLLIKNAKEIGRRMLNKENNIEAKEADSFSFLDFD